MASSSRRRAEADRDRVELILARYYDLERRRGDSARFDATLAHRLLRIVGDQLRCNGPLPGAVRSWRRTEARANLSLLVDSMTRIVVRTRLDDGGVGLGPLLRVRDFIESWRAAFRWVCRRRDFAPGDFPAWAELSRRVRDIDDTIARRAAAAQPGDLDLWPVDAHDPASWLARLGVRGPAPGDAEAPSPWWLSPGDDAPSWRAVDDYLRRGGHAEQVERRADDDPAFAEMLALLIGVRGRGLSRAASRWAARRSEARAARRERESRPVLRARAAAHPGGPDSTALSSVTISTSLPLKHAPRAMSACDACRTCYLGTGAGTLLCVPVAAGVAVRARGLRPDEPRRASERPLVWSAPVEGSVSALCHAHLPAALAAAWPGQERMVLVGTEDGVLHGFAESRGHLEAVWSAAVPDARGGIAAVEAWRAQDGAAAGARSAIVATRGGGVVVLEMRPRGIRLRRLDLELCGAVRTVVRVAGGALCLSTSGELVSIPAGALRGKAAPRILERFPGATGVMAALDRGYAPVLMIAGQRGAWIYEVASRRCAALAWPGAGIESAATAALPGGRHVAIGTADGVVTLWNIEGLRARDWDSECLGAEPSLPIVLSNPRHGPAGASLIAALQRGAAGRLGGQLLVATSHPRLHVLHIGEPALPAALSEAAGVPSSEKGPVSGLRCLIGDEHPVRRRGASE